MSFLDPPSGTSVTITPSNSTVLQGNTVTFNCTTDANPAATDYKLYHNGNQLGSNASGIISTQVTDSGNYTCVPISSLGTGENVSVNINVVGKDHVFMFDYSLRFLLH